MALNRGAQQPESVAVGTILICAIAAYIYSLSRFLAARTAEMIFDVIYRMAASPVEVAFLTAVALWLASWSLDRHNKAAQLLSSLQLNKLLSSLIIQSASAAAQRQHPPTRQQQPPHKEWQLQQGEKQQQPSTSSKDVAAGVPAILSSPSANPGSSSCPSKELTSHRLPEPGVASGGTNKGRRRGGPPASQNRQQQQHQQQQQQRGYTPQPPPSRGPPPGHRWSVDAAGGGSNIQRYRRQLVGVRPKPRTSLDFEALPAAPRRSRPQSTAAAAVAAAHRHRARRQLSVWDHRAAFHLGSGSTGNTGGTAGAQLVEGTSTTDVSHPPAAATTGTASSRDIRAAAAASGSTHQPTAASAAGNATANAPVKNATPAAAEQHQHQQRQERWQPSMHRIASGQELADLAAAPPGWRHISGSTSSTTSSAVSTPTSAGTAEGAAGWSSFFAPSAQHPQQQERRQRQEPATAATAAEQCSVAAAVSASGAAGAPSLTLSAWLPSGAYLLGWGPFTFPVNEGGSGVGGATAATAATTTPPSTPRKPGTPPSTTAGTRGDGAAGSTAAVDSSTGSVSSSTRVGDGAVHDPSEPPPTPLSPLSQWVASTGTACAAWATSTVDALLWRAPSSPTVGSQLDPYQGQGEEERREIGGQQGRTLLQQVQWQGHGSQHPTGAAIAPCPSAPLPHRRSSEGYRRYSLDGCSTSARHYTYGAVQAESYRRQTLEQLARAARRQLPPPLHGPSVGGSAAGAALPPTKPLIIEQAAAGAAAAPGVLELGVEADAGRSALASVGLDGDCPQSIRRHVTDEHLLQFAAATGDPPSAAAAAKLGLPPAWADEGALMGAADEPAACGDGAWEQVIDRHEGGLRYEVYRQPLRRGLYMYRSRALYEGVAPADVRPFHLDDHARDLWDENVLEIRRLRPEGQEGSRLHRHSEWCLHQYRTRFPRPMAAREYQYARRVWHRPADGGCYIICRGLPLPDQGDAYRAVKVTDISSACVIREAAGGAGTEVVSLYFEDSLVRPGLAKMAVKGMWAYMQNYEAALRVFAEARQMAATQHTASALASSSGGSATATSTPRRRLSSEQHGFVAPAAPSGASSCCKLAGVAGGGDGVGYDTSGGASYHSGCSSSGEDDATHSACAAMARRLGRAGRGSGSAGGSCSISSGSRGQMRWAGRLMILAGIKVVHGLLAARSR